MFCTPCPSSDKQSHICSHTPAPLCWESLYLLGVTKAKIWWTLLSWALADKNVCFSKHEMIILKCTHISDGFILGLVCEVWSVPSHVGGCQGLHSNKIEASWLTHQQWPQAPPWLPALVPQRSQNKVPRVGGWLKQQKCVHFQFWRTEVVCEEAILLTHDQLICLLFPSLALWHLLGLLVQC